MLLRRIDEKHDMLFGNGLADFAIEAEATAQSVHTRLLLLRGEWFLDTDAGVPWLQQIMVKPADLALAEAIIKQTIVNTIGILDLRLFNMLFDREIRTLVVTATVSTIYGTVENIKVVQ